MADVFISYARAISGQAKRVAGALKHSGYSVWFDEGLPAHRAFSDVIEEQLAAAKAVIVLWSQDGAQSQWVRSEANHAREQAKLVQARLDDVLLPMPFDQIHCADLRKWPGKSAAGAWNSVLASIGALTRGERAPAPIIHHTTVKRRTVLVGGIAGAAAIAAGAFAWRRLGTHTSSPEAQLLLQKGLDALQTNDALESETVGSTAQAIALLTDATEADPKSATAWGALAMAYAVRKRAADPGERPGLDARSRSAAKTALELELYEPRALAALRLIEPVYRNWLNAERADREAMEHHPRHPILLFVTSDLLGSVGRWKEAAALSDRLDRTKFLIPGADRKVIINRWAAGDLQAADKALQIAVEHWPDHPQVWRTRLAYLLYTGRSLEALRVLDDQSQRPSIVPPGFPDAIGATARALIGQTSPDQAVEANLNYLRMRSVAAPFVAQACTVLGDTSTALSILTGYYFHEGVWSNVAPAAGEQDLLTGPLFQPPMMLLWKSPQFTSLLERIGLENYWRQSKTQPDWRML
jgi:tetratricopeptide (TPR) repeat protein